MTSKLFYKRIEPADYRNLKEGNLIQFSDGGRLEEATVSGIQYGLNSEAGLKISELSGGTRVLWKQPVWLEQKKGSSAERVLTLEKVMIEALQLELANHKKELDALKSRTGKLLEAVKLIGSRR